MTILATLDPVEIKDPVTDAIQAHLNSPGIPVTRICKDHGVSRATFYRRLKAVSRNLSPEAVTPVRVLAVEAPKPSEFACYCGITFPVDCPDTDVYRHWVTDCRNVAWQIRRDARKKLKELECRQATSTTQTEPSTMRPERSGNSGAVTSTDATNSAAQISGESMMPSHESSPEPSAGTDWFYSWKFDENGNVREGFSYANLLEWYWRDVKPFGTRECVTVTHPRRKA